MPTLVVCGAVIAHRTAHEHHGDDRGIGHAEQTRTDAVNIAGPKLDSHGRFGIDLRHQIGENEPRLGIRLPQAPRRILRAAFSGPDGALPVHHDLEALPQIFQLAGWDQPFDDDVALVEESVAVDDAGSHACTGMRRKSVWLSPWSTSASVSTPRRTPIPVSSKWSDS